MSPLRITTLVTASMLTVLSVIALIDVANGGVQYVHDSLVVSITCASLAGWLAFVAVAVRDRICSRIDAVEAHLDDYGDQRETNGYLAHIRDSSNTGTLSRIK